MRCYDFRVDVLCMAKLFDDENLVILGCVRCVVAQHFGCIVVQTLLVGRLLGQGLSTHRIL